MTGWTLWQNLVIAVFCCIIPLHPTYCYAGKGPADQQVKKNRSRISQSINNELHETEKLRQIGKEEPTKLAIKRLESLLHCCAGQLRPLEKALVLKSLAQAYERLGNLYQAIHNYNESLRLSESLNDEALKCDLLNKIVKVYLYLGDIEKFNFMVTQAKFLSHKIHYKTGEAEYLNNLGESEYLFGQYDQALEHHQQALIIFEQLNHRRGIAETLLHLCEAYQQKNNSEKSFEFFAKSLAAWEAVEDDLGKGMALLAGASLNLKMGDKQTGINLYEDALGLFQLVGNKLWQASVYGGLSYFYETIGDEKKALHYVYKSVQQYEVVGLQNAIALGFIKIGRLHVLAGETGKALVNFSKAQKINQRLKDKPIAIVLKQHLGMAAEADKNYRQALDYYEQALALGQEIQSSSQLAEAVEGIASVNFNLGNKSKALEQFGQALSYAKASQDDFAVSKMLYNLARVERDLSLYSQAKSHIEEGLKIIEALRESWKSPEIRTAYFSTVQKSFDLYINLLMDLHKQNQGEGFDVQALAVSERARARTLLESILETNLNFRASIDPELLKRERELLGKMTENQAQLLKLAPRSKPAQILTEENEDCATELYQIRARMRASALPGESDRRYTLQTPAEIQRLLDDQTILLEYRLGDKQSYLWAVTPREIFNFELPSRAEIENLASALYKLLVASEDSAIAKNSKKNHLTIAHPLKNNHNYAEKLSEILLSPVANLLPGKRLVIVADGALQYLPFAVLPLPKSICYKLSGNNDTPSGPRPLVLSNEIVNLSSASLIALLREKKRVGQSPEKSLAIIADPVFTANDTRFKKPSSESPVNSKRQPFIAQNKSQPFLTPVIEYWIPKLDHLAFAAREAENIATAAQGMPVLTISGFDANKAMLLQTDLSQYRFVHFATHGLVDSYNPDLSCIVLSLFNKKNEPQDGLLLLQDICGLKLRADLVVLSACKTALGKSFRGEGLIGLNRAFMQAGAKRVIASLWDVDDAATAELMKRLYTGIFLEGLSPGASLRKAQASMSQEKRWKSPYFWAAFVMQGEWQ